MMFRDIIFYSIMGIGFLVVAAFLVLLVALGVGYVTTTEQQMQVILTDISYGSSGDVIYSFCEKDVCYKLTEGNKANVDYFVVGNEYTAYYHNYWWGTEFDRLEG